MKFKANLNVENWLKMKQIQSKFKQNSEEIQRVFRGIENDWNSEEIQVRFRRLKKMIETLKENSTKIQRSFREKFNNFEKPLKIFQPLFRFPLKLSESPLNLLWIFQILLSVSDQHWNPSESPLNFQSIFKSLWKPSESPLNFVWIFSSFSIDFQWPLKFIWIFSEFSLNFSVFSILSEFWLNFLWLSVYFQKFLRETLKTIFGRVIGLLNWCRLWTTMK